MIDVDELKRTKDLVALAGRDTKLTKVSATDGGEYAGPCPRCGGRDRFHVKASGYWMCRQCQPHWSDIIGYLQWLHGVSFRGAIELLDTENLPKPPENAPKPALECPTIKIPGAEWQKSAAAFVGWTEKRLAESATATAYLFGRGLTPETIKAAHLGYNPRTMYRPASKWGLAGDKLELPAGWVIPCYTGGGQLAYIKIRQPDGVLPKYRMISGSHVSLYGADRARGTPDLILCEGEFDALLAAQAVAGIADVVTLGGAQGNPTPDTLRLMVCARRIWLAYDADRAGIAGADKVAGLSEKINRLTWPTEAPEGAKDITDLYHAGISLSGWLLSQIGPRDADQRREWVLQHLERLDKAAEYAGVAELAAWLALLGEYERYL